VYGSGGWMWCSATRVCHQHACCSQRRQSLQSSMAAIDAALAPSNTDMPWPAANDAPASKLHCLLKRRLQLCTTEDRVKIAVEDLIAKYRTNEELCRVQGMVDAAAKYGCYSTTCVTRDGQSAALACYSPLCRSLHEQESTCKLWLPFKLKQDVYQLSCTVAGIEDENMVNGSSTNRDAASKSSSGSHNKSESIPSNLHNNCVRNNEDMDPEQSADSGISEDRTWIRDSTKELRLLFGLLRKHACNGQISLTKVLVSRLQSLLDCGTDTRNSICLRGAIRKSAGQKRTEIPTAHGFRNRSCRQSVFVLQPSTTRHLARSGGLLFTIPGFSSAISTKSDYGWMYVGPRPLFSTAWQYRTASARNLSAVALQLRVLWCCIRWDDMSSDSSIEDAGVAMETDMVTRTTILRQRDVGQDGLHSEYLVRRVKAPAAAADDWHGNLRVTELFMYFM